MKKSKLITMAVSFLLTVGMIGAGFAAWIISAPTQASVEGSVTVDTVVDKRIKLSDPVTTNAGITFGAPASASTGWLTYEGTAREDLESEISFNITNQKALYDAGVRQITLAFAINTTDLASYVTDGYITVPTNANVKVGDAVASDGTSFTVDIADSTDNIAVTVKYTFGWGSLFGANNPYTFFAGKTDPNAISSDNTKGWADFALEKLQTLEALDEETFGITITASVVTTPTV